MNVNEHVVTEIHINRHKRSLKIRTRLMIVKINLRQHEFYELSANMPTKGFIRSLKAIIKFPFRKGPYHLIGFFLPLTIFCKWGASVLSTH